MSEKGPENKEAPSPMERKPQEKQDAVKALGALAIKNSGRK
jgi:hypothetical protein